MSDQSKGVLFLVGTPVESISLYIAFYWCFCFFFHLELGDLG